MKTYKVIFARNEVLVCVETRSGMPDGERAHLEHNSHGAPIYALVQADDAAEACTIAKDVVAKAGIPRRVGDPSSESA